MGVCPAVWNWDNFCPSLSCQEEVFQPPYINAEHLGSLKIGKNWKRKDLLLSEKGKRQGHGPLIMMNHFIFLSAKHDQVLSGVHKTFFNEIALKISLLSLVYLLISISSGKRVDKSKRGRVLFWHINTTGTLIECCFQTICNATMMVEMLQSLEI